MTPTHLEAVKPQATTEIQEIRPIETAEKAFQAFEAHGPKCWEEVEAAYLAGESLDRVFYMAGRLEYGGHMDRSRRALQASLQSQLQGLELLEGGSETAGYQTLKAALDTWTEEPSPALSTMKELIQDRIQLIKHADRIGFNQTVMELMTKNAILNQDIPDRIFKEWGSRVQAQVQEQVTKVQAGQSEGVQAKIEHILQGVSFVQVLATQVSNDHWPEKLAGWESQIDRELERFPSLEHWIMTSDRTAIAQQLTKIEDKECFQLAKTLRWLGHTYQNLDQFKKATPENIQRFQFIYGVCEDILRDMNLNNSENQEVKRELAEFYYNQGRFSHLLVHPDDKIGAMKTLDVAMQYNDEPSFNARCLNIQAATCAEQKDLEAARLKYDKAIKVAEETEGFDPFLISMYHNNRACLLLKMEPIDWKQFDEDIQIAIDHAKGCHFDHYYYSAYFVNQAKGHCLAGELGKARESLDMADVICAKFPESSGELEKRVREVRLQIAQQHLKAIEE